MITKRQYVETLLSTPIKNVTGVYLVEYLEGQRHNQISEYLRCEKITGSQPYELVKETFSK